MKIYIAGPMTGYPNYNFDAFNMATNNFRFLGWDVLNPAEQDAHDTLSEDSFSEGDTALAIKKGFDMKEVYRKDVNWVIDADAIYMLKGWEASPGARGEHAVAVCMQKHYPEYQIMYESS